MEAVMVDNDAHADAVVLHVKGDVDSGTFGELVSHLNTALAQAATHPIHLLIVDLRGVTYFGSAGLNAVLDCHHKARAAATTLRVVADNLEVLRPIEVTNLDQVLEVYRAFDEAVQHRDGKLS
ncbi:MAG: STAS domain-containing protein [Actinomycetia bacterium]|nr:STAS domain-containing protein [Actinomycetes bacterium]